MKPIRKALAGQKTSTWDKTGAGMESEQVSSDEIPNNRGRETGTGLREGPVTGIPRAGQRGLRRISERPDRSA